MSVLSLALWAQTALALPLDAGVAPTSTLSLTVNALKSARQSILLNIYEMSAPQIRDVLIDRVQAGVHVEILAEGQPVGGISKEGRALRSALVQAMRDARGTSKYYEMTALTGSRRRYRYDHAKYAVIDGQHLLIGSENYSSTGQTPEGAKGNRGWEVFLHDRAISRSYEAVFREDADLSAGDVSELTSKETLQQEHEAVLAGWDTWNLGWLTTAIGIGEPTPWAGLPEEDPGLGTFVAGRKPPTPLDADAVERVTSPHESLNGLLSLIRSARRTLDIEQMTFDSGWGRGGQEGPSPLFDAVLEAARRGVTVRVLLNDETSFGMLENLPRPLAPPRKKTKNQVTVEAFNRFAQLESLPLKARICDVERMGITYIHNKGVLTDGNRTLVSSINWNWNSVTNNREAAVVVVGSQVHDHYKRYFDSDWRLSAPRVGITDP